MKKLKLLLLGVMTVILVTGCGMKAEYGLVVSKDKNVSVEVLSAMDDEMIDYYLGMSDESDDDSEEEKTYTDKERWEYLENSSEEDDEYKDYSKSKYDKDGYKGYIYTLDLGDIDSVSSSSSESITLEEISKDSTIFTKKGDVYSLNIEVSEEDNSQMESYSEYVDFDLTFKITLPNKAKSNNATSVSKDGLTYTWDLTKTSDINLSFAFDDTSSTNNTTMYIIIGSIASLVIIGCVVIVSLNKNKNKA